ncbi:MAG: export protein secB [Pseudomonadota bacterium]|jgi:preprotein translocase subunit SecB
MSNENTPKISVEAQYIKDLSFENPNAPASLAGGKKPVIDLSLDLHVVRVAEEKDVFEVILTVEAKATSEEQSLFVVELVYSGVFTVSNVTEEERKIILGVHCPALLFPFARSIIANVTQSGGLQPLMIDPIDFGALYHSKMMQDAAEAEKAGK